VWSAPCIRRRGVLVSWFGLKTKVDGFSRFGLKTSGFGFLGLDLKTGSFSLVVWTSKPLRRFHGLGLKTKWATVCRLRQKPDGRMKMAYDTRQDLASCFTWKQVGLGFPYLATRLVEAQHGWYTWHHCEGHAEMKLKTNESMRWAGSDPTTPTLPFSLC
jgi:hypothetical protein